MSPSKKRIVNRAFSYGQEGIIAEDNIIEDMIKINVREASQQYSRYKSRNNKLTESRNIKRLNELENMYSHSPRDDNLLTEIHKIQTKIEISDINKARGAQIRSRIKYVEEGEKNTAFFSGLEKSQSNTNTIKRLTLASGKQTCCENEILEEITIKFKERYNKPSKDRISIFSEVEKFTKDLNITTSRKIATTREM